MLDNEPNAGATGPDGETIEQPEVTSRRRSASRPAGPPPELPEEPASAPVTVAAAQAAPSVADVQAVQRTAAQRAAGEPAPELLAERAAAGTAEAGEVSPVEGAVAEAVAEAVDEKPKRATRTRSTATTTRRRTTKKAAEAEAEAAVAAPEAEAAGEAAAEAPVKRRRTRKKAEAEEAAAPAAGAEAWSVEDSAARAGGVEAGAAEGAEVVAPSGGGEVVAPFGDEAAVAGAGGQAPEGVAGPAAGEAAAAGTARRRTRKATTAKAGKAGAVAAGAGEAEGAAVTGGEPGGTAVTAGEAGGAAAGAGEGLADAGVTGGEATGVEAAAGKGRAAGARRGRAAAGAGTARAGADEGAAAAGAGTAGAGAGEGAAAAGASEADEDILEILPEDEPLDDEPAGEDLDEDNVRPSLLADPFGLTARRDVEPGGAAFQRPAAIFAPLFQAPDPSQAKPVVQRKAEPQPAPEPEEAEEPVDESVTEDETDLDTSDEQEEEGGGRRRRRRRGGRGRGKTRERDEAEDGEESEEEGDEEQAEEAQEEESSTSRRRRRRRRRGADEGAEPASDDPPNTVVRIRAPRSGRTGALETATDGVQSVRGSTRLEAKKQRRREGRELGRRRPPIITESEFLARRESVDRMMVVRRQGDRTQIAVLEDGVLVEHYVNREASQSYVGNVYLGKVQNVLPSMEAAFVDIGKGRNAVLYAGEVNFDTAGLEGQPKRIESALKSGQSVLVQVTKDPIGHKGARLTSQISLPGRYLVYVPDGSMTGISRKLPDKERTRLKSILKKVMPENAGVIVRTAAEGASEEELARDVARLSAQWESIQKKAKSASPPELLSAEPDLTIRVVRDVFNEDFTNLVVQGDEAWDTVDDYVKYVAPHLAERLSKWDDGEHGDVFESYRIDEQLSKAMERKVWLPSGGSLVIDRTEAMTVVDVNTGKFTGQGGNLEETVTRNNLEAAEEIVRQLRLRDIGGIIVIDFIDMVLESNRDLVLRRLLECLARDRTKHQVAEVTSLGLVQMTRKRVGQGLLEAFSTPCECCNGRGLLVSTEPVESKPEPRGTQGKMAVEKAVQDKVSAAKDSSSRDTVTGALDDVPAEDDQASQTSGRGRRRSRRAKSAE
ncbi:Rne/Rng family ribonuclease [Nonomuraea rubra]|uniref:Ribonuclease E n=1 Tax=Nonomuraea rubra TaxID=46180 RepID=A0A7X0NQ64_9ACTN|nr:Rne/Rng family ribonuclease [Nonomuraea rubra]MBB6547593.1 ribonuclease E [Nonomuraea rubra]